MRPLAAPTLLVLALLAVSPLAAQAAGAEKEIPIIVEEEAAAPEAGKKAEIVTAPAAAETAKKKAAKKAAPAAAEAAKPVAEAKRLRGGESAARLMKTFVKYRPDIALDPSCYDEGSAGFDEERARGLADEITAWKKLRLEAKALKGKDAAAFEKKYQEVRSLEERIRAAYGKGAAPAAAAETAADEPEAGNAAASAAAALAREAKTPEARRILERVAGKGAPIKEEERAKRSEDEEDRRASRDEAEERMEKVRREREGSRYLPSKIRFRPSRVLFNRLEPGGTERSVFTIRNAGRSTFEGAVVAIEDWIAVTPPTVLIEPNAEIEIDVQVKAPEKKNARVEGSIEIRSVGESSRRVPIVLRTVRK